MLWSHFYEFLLVFSPHTLWFFEPPLFYTPARKLEFYLPWAATHFPWFSLHLKALKKKKRKKRLHRGKRQWHFVPFSLEDSFSYHTRRSCLFRILASTGPYFLPLLVPSLPDCFRAGIWDWRKKKRKMEIFDSFFSFFFFLTIRKYFVSKPKLKNFWSSLCFLFFVFFFCCCWGRGFVFDWDHGY